MAITPAPGYMIDPNNPNGVIPIGSNSSSGTVTPVSLGPISATGGVTSSPTPTVTAVGATAASQTTTPATPAQTDTSASSAPPPPSVSGNLQPGSTGSDVAALQSYLVQTGYLTADQVGTGSGTYGPQTTAAVAKLQKDLGLNPTSGSGYYGPQTKSALTSKYNSLFQSVKNTSTPINGGEAAAAISSATQPSTDPVFNSMSSSLGPIMDSLNQVLQNINNPALTAVSLQDEYNQLAQANNLPALQATMLNMQNVMNGTTDDIRNEITSAGGFATDSQVMGMSAARNNVILKQYNALATQYQAAQTNVQNQMQYATADQQTQLQRQQATAGVVESMASIEQQALSMGLTMQQNAKQAVQYNVTQTGYSGLAASAQGNPQVLGYYENMLSLAPGTLSDPNSLAALDTYKQQQLAVSQQNAQNAANRTIIYGFNAGYGVGGTQPQITPNPGGGPTITQPIPTSSLQRPNWLPSSVPLTMSDGQMKQYAASSKASIDPGTNNVIAPGIGYYLQQSDGSYVLNSAIPQQVATSSVDSQYQSMVTDMQKAQAIPVSGSPLNKGRLSRNANTALKNYVGSTIYSQVSNGVSYLARVKAAMSNPGSISDTELADAIIKINTGGGQVTEAQISTYFTGQSYADKFAVQGDKIIAKGGVLSPQQRQDLASLAQETFTNYQTQYEQLYVQAGQNLIGQGIPLNYLANIPDFTQLLQGQTAQVQ